MAELTVRILLNITDTTTASGVRERCIMFDGYETGDHLREVLSYTVTVDDEVTDAALNSICEQAFMVCNLDPEMMTGAERAVAQQYRAGRNRSLSVGDVVVVGDVAKACSRIGFTTAYFSADQIVEQANRTRCPVRM
ncbi:hypothetical protein [Gordonia otitidis]|uniref:Uncharacterized protein n=1 Tax=Gordonia otitidis (strain DSM 44809 / CCUG 52243 / JCM 12355 / NBRC 100426 / IFM 10032) TaxID=1108044 RepID=H5TSK1_GORO1|nr:hypothetical protein [Gordonia otitidis]GAB36459.1 hypothetical protein GOOTI_221_00020 [Gordonia otitidis NBRC 100426]